MPSFDSISAYTRCGFEGAIASPTRPVMPPGRPCPRRRVHVTPPLTDFQMPSSSPPDVNVHGLRANCQMPAYSTSGFVRVGDQLAHAAARSGVQRLRPRLAAVGRAVHAALGRVREHVAERADQHDVRVARIDDDGRDRVRRAQSHVRPGLAAVGRLVETVAPRHVVARVRLAGAHPHDVVVLRVDRDRADGRDALRVEHRRPGRAAVHRLPHAAARRAETVQFRIAGDAGDRRDAAAGHGRPDLTEGEAVVRRVGGRGRGDADGAGEGAAERRDRRRGRVRLAAPGPARARRRSRTQKKSAAERRGAAAKRDQPPRSTRRVLRGNGGRSCAAEARRC